MAQDPVTLFSDRQFAGSSVPLDEGDTRFSSDFNDTASSIRVAPGYCAMLYEHANEFSGYGAWVDLLEDCPDLAVYGFDKKTSYVHVFRAERDGFVWARGAMRDGQFIPGHWERKRASGVSPNSAVAVVAPPLPPRTTPLPAGDGVVIRDHRGEPRFATFTMDNFGISNTRSLHNDTDFVYLSATVGANPPVFVEEIDGRCEQRHPFRWIEHRSRHSRRRYDRGVQLPDHEQRPWRQRRQGEGRAGRVVHHRQRDRQAQGRSRRAPSPSDPSWCRSSPPPSRRSPEFWRLVEAGLLLFADCDGVVAAGTLPFKCSDLIKRTSSGQKISDNTDHPGTDSADGCGSNSHYSTSCTIATAPSIQTVLDLSGAVGQRRGRRDHSSP